jgi:hypothetical protein
MSPSQLACSLALAMCVASAPAFADALLTDSTFNLANYTQLGPFEFEGTISAAQCATCGNPGNGLKINETFGDTTTTTGETALGFVNNTVTYNPSISGPIVSINASVDKDATITGIGGTLGNTFRPLIEQDGNYYLAAIAGASFSPTTSPFTTGYISFSELGLVATDFLQFDFTTGLFGTASPNFAGDPMEFGLAQITTLAGVTAGATLEQDYDNLSLTTSTPEPSSVLLLSTLVLLIGFALRRARFQFSRQS